MATTKKRTKAEKEKRAKLLNEVATKHMMSSSAINGISIINYYQKTDFGKNDFGEKVKMDINTLTKVMEEVADQVKIGNLSNLEEMLVCQTYSLQHMFMTMAAKASGTTNPDHIELLSKFSLKAQNQCRTTIATLSEMKNPKRATFIKQQNNAVNQQINQGKNSENLTKPANELLEKTHGERLDTRETEEAIRTNQELETVGEVHRSKDS